MTKLAGTRVAMIVPSLRGGGLERVVADLTLALQQRGLTLAVFTVSNLGVHAERLQQAGIECVACGEGPLRLRGVPIKLIRALGRFKPDLMHAHSGTWYPSAVARTILMRAPLTYTEHGRYPPEPALRAMVERWCAERTGVVMAVSDAVSRYLQDFLRLRTPPRVIENGIDLAPYRAARPLRDDVRRSWGIAPGDVALLALGRLAPVKNHALMLDAFARALPDAPKLQLMVVGQGDLDQDLRARAAALGIERRVHFLGYRTDVAACLSGADVFINTSTTEGLPISLLEAMATGLPTVATAVGGVPSALGEPAAGILVPSGDVTALTDAIRRVGCEDATRRRFSELALSRAERFSLDRCADRHLEVYAGLLGSA